MNPTTTLGRRLKELRERAGLSQSQLAAQVGVSRSALSQTENAARKVCSEELVKLAQALNSTVGILVGAEIEPELAVARQAPANQPLPMLRNHIPQRDLVKFREVLLYVLKYVGSRPNTGESTLYKLLYFIDFDYYEKYEEQLIGAAYIHNQYGPTPREFRQVVTEMCVAGELERVRSRHFNYPQTKYLPLRDPDLTALSGLQVKHIDEVLERLADMSAQQISDYSHADFPWRSTAPGKDIDYEMVFYRTAPYSQREYVETD
ncbi:MAG: type II toxin-antitoxin system antitoxin SocA domain-containing protein [bacterium]